MGYIKHSAVIITVHGPHTVDIEAFRESLPEEFRPLVIGPVYSVVNMYTTYAFLPDGSKEGWAESEQGDQFREAFINLFEGPDGVEVEFGGDHHTEFGGPTVRAIREWD